MRSRRSKAWRQRKQVREMEAILDGPRVEIIKVEPQFYGIVAPYHHTRIDVFKAQVEMYQTRVKMYQAQAAALVEEFKKHAFKKK